MKELPLWLWLLFAAMLIAGGTLWIGRGGPPQD